MYYLGGGESLFLDARVKTNINPKLYPTVMQIFIRYEHRHAVQPSLGNSAEGFSVF